MDLYEQLDAMIDLAESLAIPVRRVALGDNAEHPGGAVARLKDRWTIFLDVQADPSDQLKLIASALRDRPEMKDRFLVPELRELLDGPPDEL